MLHSIYHYVPRVGMPALPWDELYFSSKGEVTCGTVGYTNWPIVSLHQIGVTIYVLMTEAINTVLARKTSMNLMEKFSTENAGVNVIRGCKTIYLPTPYMGVFMGGGSCLLKLGGGCEAPLLIP